MAQQIPLQKLLHAIDTKDRDFYDNLTNDEKKSFSGYIAMRWASCIEKGYRDRHEPNPDFVEYFILSTNSNANKNIFDLNKHPKLQWLMITSISPGMGVFNHGFVKHKPKPKDASNEIKKELAKLFPTMKDDDLTTLSKIVSKKEINQYIKDFGEGN